MEYNIKFSNTCLNLKHNWRIWALQNIYGNSDLKFRVRSFQYSPFSSPSQIRLAACIKKRDGMSVYEIRINVIISPAHVSPNLKPNSVPQIRPLPHTLRTPSIDFISIFLSVRRNILKYRLPLLLQIFISCS